MVEVRAIKRILSVERRPSWYIFSDVGRLKIRDGVRKSHCGYYRPHEDASG